MQSGTQIRGHSVPALPRRLYSHADGSAALAAKPPSIPATPSPNLQPFAMGVSPAFLPTPPLSLRAAVTEPARRKPCAVCMSQQQPPRSVRMVRAARRAGLGAAEDMEAFLRRKSSEAGIRTAGVMAELVRGRQVVVHPAFEALAFA